MNVHICLDFCRDKTISFHFNWVFFVRKEFVVKTFNLLFFIKTNFTSVNNSVAQIIRHHAQLTAPRVHESTEPVGTEAETLENVSGLILFYSHLACERVRADVTSLYRRSAAMLSRRHAAH